MDCEFQCGSVGSKAWELIQRPSRRASGQFARSFHRDTIIDVAVICHMLLRWRRKYICKRYVGGPFHDMAIELGSFVREIRRSTKIAIESTERDYLLMDRFAKKFANRWHGKRLYKIQSEAFAARRLEAKTKRLDAKCRILRERAAGRRTTEFIAGLIAAHVYEKKKQQQIDQRRKKRPEWLDRTRERRRKQKRLWKQKNRASYLSSKKRWEQKNPAKIRAYHNASRRKRNAAERGTAIDKSASIFYRSKPKRAACHWCGKTTPSALLHADHIVPLARGGHHSAYNLCWSCADCNAKKCAQDPNQFSRGQLVLKYC
jgi:5-methylcytosine-specific restriction endonuclease McrA